MSVEVKPNSKKPRVEKQGDVYIVWVDAPPTEGKANKRVVELLAELFEVPKSAVSIRRGLGSRRKIVDIGE